MHIIETEFENSTNIHVLKKVKQYQFDYRDGEEDNKQREILSDL